MPEPVVVGHDVWRIYGQGDTEVSPPKGLSFEIVRHLGQECDRYRARAPDRLKSDPRSDRDLSRGHDLHGALAQPLDHPRRRLRSFDARKRPTLTRRGPPTTGREGSNDRMTSARPWDSRSIGRRRVRTSAGRGITRSVHRVTVSQWLGSIPPCRVQGTCPSGDFTSAGGGAVRVRRETVVPPIRQEGGEQFSARAPSGRFGTSYGTGLTPQVSVLAARSSPAGLVFE